MGEVVLAHTSHTLQALKCKISESSLRNEVGGSLTATVALNPYGPLPLCCNYPVWKYPSASIVVTSDVRITS